MLVDLAVALLPGVLLGGADAEPQQEAGAGDAGLVGPAVDEVHDGIAGVMGTQVEAGVILRESIAANSCEGKFQFRLRQYTAAPRSGVVLPHTALSGSTGLRADGTTPLAPT